jgi:hypothetical protein
MIPELSSYATLLSQTNDTQLHLRDWLLEIYFLFLNMER